MQNSFFTTSDSRCSRSSSFENKPKFCKILRSNSRKFLLIS
ncbi:alpha-mannosidase [Enterococcus faecium]|nr:alpha-mannosidase [Enterococcus faecium]